MAAHPWLSRSTEELLAIALAGEYPPTHPASVALQLLIQKRIADAQLQAAAHTAQSGEQLATLTSSLVKATRALVRATWAVAIVTALIGLIAAIPLIAKCAR
jgi:hypothetical protein